MFGDLDPKRWAKGEPFPHSTKKINRVGNRLRKAGGTPDPQDLKILDEFRAWHYPTLRHCHDRIGRMLRQMFGRGAIREGYVAATARPLKTPEAIIAKLVREKTRLATMQDIAGTRVRVPDLEVQDAVTATVLDRFRKCAPAVSDTREEGSQYGYRAVHVVISLQSRFAEIQIRTLYQEAFAQTVEAADQFLKSDLKHGRGPAEWLEWLHELSDALRNGDLGRSVVIPPSPLDRGITP